MSDPVSLLPGNATPWERALSLTSAAARPLDSDIIRRYKDPWQCPAHLLPFLAFERSVDIWDDRWTETKKRSVIARAPELHRLKGSIGGIRAYVEIAGGSVRRVRYPPEGIFADDFDAGHRETWLSRFAQLRVYTRKLREYDPDPYLGEVHAGGSDNDGFYPDAVEDLPVGRIAVVWDNGITTPVVRTEQAIVRDGAEAVVETYSPVGHGSGFFAGFSHPEEFLDPPVAAPVLTVERVRLAGPRVAFERVEQAVRGQFIDISPERVRDRADDPAGVYADGTFLDAAYLEDGIDPATLVYERWRIYDPARSGTLPGTGYSFLDDPAWFRLDAFTLLLDVELQDFLPRSSLIDDGFEGDFLEPHDTRAADLVLDAVQSAQADRDRVLVRFAHHRTVRLGDRPRLPFKLDSLVKD